MGEPSRDSTNGTHERRWAGARIEDPVFGSLVYSATEGWSGSVDLGRLGRRPLAVYYLPEREPATEPIPPTDSQREAFRLFLGRHEQLFLEVEHLAAANFRDLIELEGGRLAEDAGVWQHLHDLRIYVEESGWEPGVVSIHLHWDTPLDDEHGYTATVLTESGVQSVLNG